MTTYRHAPVLTFVLGVLLLPAVAAIGATVFVLALLVGTVEFFSERWPTYTILFGVAVLLAAVMIGATYER